MGSKLTDAHKFEVWQGGIVVASGEAPSREEAEREMMHYAFVYGQDGAVMAKLTPAGRTALEDSSPMEVKDA